MTTDPATIPGLISALSRAISDPGSVLDREPFAQSVHDWQVGAAANAIAPFLARPAGEHADRLTGADEKRERVLADWSPQEHAIVVSNSVTGQSVRFGEKAWDAFRASRHHPDSACDCEPGNAGACEFRMLADAVGDAFNPPGDDVAEVAIFIDAVTRARDALAGMRCRCTPATVADQEPCSRCEALGQLGGKAVPR